MKIRNFRGIDDKDLIIQNLNIFLGNCGSGKTSILRALCFVLTGEVDTTDIRDGANSTSVYIAFEDGSTVERERDFSGTTVRVNGKKSTAKAADEYLNSILGFDVSILPALIGINFFEEISKRDLTDFFTKVLPCSIDYDKMVALILSKYTLSDKAIEYMKQWFPDGTYGLDVIDIAYKEAFAQRKAKKTILANLSKIDLEGITKPTESKEELNKALFVLAEKEAEIKNYEKNLNAYNASLKAKADAEAKLLELQKELEKFANITAPDESVLAQAKEDRKKFDDAIGRSQGLKATADANIASFQKILDALAGDRCVACKDIICTTDKSCARGELEARIKDNSRVAKEHEDFIIRCKEQIVKRDVIIENYNANLLQYTKKASLEKQIKEFVIPAVLEKPKAVESVDTSSEKALINKKLELITQFEMADKCEKDRVAMQEEVSMLETIVAVLDVKTGVRTLILQRALATFETVCNDKASSLDASMEVSFKANDGIEVYVKTKNSNGFIPMSKVSTGQSVIVSYLLMCLVAEVTKGKYMIIDNIDKLDVTYAKALLELIEKDNTFDNVFLAGVSHEDIKLACEGKNVTNL